MKLLKRILLSIGVIAVIVFFCSCKEQPKIPEISTVLDNNAKVTYQGQTYDCHINYVSPTTASVTFHTPDTIKNMTLRRADGQYALSLGTLICRTDSSLLKDSAVPMQIINMLDGVKKSKTLQFKSADEKTFTFTTQINGETVTVTTDPKGNLQKLNTPNLKITISS